LPHAHILWPFHGAAEVGCVPAHQKSKVDNASTRPITITNRYTPHAHDVKTRSLPFTCTRINATVRAAIRQHRQRQQKQGGSRIGYDPYDRIPDAAAAL
jgi:hypothetical protein